MEEVLDQSVGSVEPICLIDGDSLIYYEMDKITLEEALKGLDSRILTILEQCKTSQYVGFLTDHNCFRYKVDTNYKGNRKHRPKPILFPALREYLKQRWGFYGVEGLEADDLVSYYSKTDPRKTIICSPDKDVLHQCAGMHFNYRTLEFLHTSPDEAEQFLWKQVLMGDSTDNIIGIPGVGVKTAENWLKGRTTDVEAFVLSQYIKKFGSTEGIMQFYTNFKLVYLLQTADDIKRELKESLPTLNPLTYLNSPEPEYVKSDDNLWE
jgi:5'-3' exonuclease